MERQLRSYRMSAPARLVAASASTLWLLACAPALTVRTAEAPDAHLSDVNTYHFLPTGRGTREANPAQSANPLIDNSISRQQVRHDIEAAMAARGYRLDREGAGLSIAYYGGVRNRVQVTDYGYGYPFWGWGWRWGPGWGMWPSQEVTSYEQGTLIIDVLDAAGRRLLWRGVARGDVPSSEDDYAKAIDRAVHAIMQHFPGHASA